MQDQQRLPQALYLAGDLMGVDILEELPFDREGPPGKIDLGLAFFIDLIELGQEVMGDVGGLGRCPDHRHGLQIGNVGSGRQDGRATERMADHDGWCPIVLAKVIDREQQVLHVEEK